MNDPRPMAIVHADLRGGMPEIHAPADRDVQLVLWWGEQPLGETMLPPDGLTPRALADVIGWTVANAVGEHAVGAGFEGADPAIGLERPDEPPAVAAVLGAATPLRALDREPGAPGAPLKATVAICTRDRPGDLARCLASIARAGRAPAELLVIDNAPSDATREVVEAAGARWVPEPRPGLSEARNRAILEANGDVLAFVDDDVEVHPRWLDRLLEPFDDPQTMAVTGLVLPAALDTTSQVRFEKVLGGFGRGYQSLTYDPAWLERSEWAGAPVWQVGAGANMALRRAVFDAIGRYDVRLGAGASGCSEDSELFYRILAAGHRCRYQPQSVVFHHHREDEGTLRHQAREYIRGHVSSLFVQYARHGHAGNLRRAFAHMPRWYLTLAVEELWRRGVAALGGVPSYPSRPIAAELEGYARGLAYLPLVLDRPTSGGKARRVAFLRRNPFENPLTEGFFYREKMRAIHRVSPASSPAEVLEVGGGRSGMARLLYPEARITTIDLDPEHASAPVNQDPLVRFMVADATALPFDDDSFDVVTMFDLLEHVPDDEAAVREAKRVVRPGGHIVVSSPNERWRSPYHRIMRRICPTDEDMMQRWGHVRRGYTLADYGRLFGAAPARHVDFINPVTVVGHDLAFSHLPRRLRRALLLALGPVTWAGYLLQPPRARGTETAACWRV